MAQFPLPYNSEVNKTTTYATQEVRFASQKVQVQQLAVKPLVEWEISCRGTMDEFNAISDFFDDMGGNTRTFTFEDESGVDQTVRFKDNKLNLKVLRDFSPTSGTKGIPVGFTGTITLEKVI